MIKTLIPRAVIKNPSIMTNTFTDYSLPLASLSSQAPSPQHSCQEVMINYKGIGVGDSSGVKESNLPSHVSGLSIKLAGRLTTQKMIPRQTVQSIQEGSLARGKVHFIEKARFTNKNKRGTYSFTLSISHT